MSDAVQQIRDGWADYRPNKGLLRRWRDQLLGEKRETLYLKHRPTGKRIHLLTAGSDPFMSYEIVSDLETVFYKNKQPSPSDFVLEWA